MFENMDEVEDKRVIVDEILDNLDEVVKNQWGAFVIQHSKFILGPNFTQKLTCVSYRTWKCSRIPSYISLAYQQHGYLRNPRYCSQVYPQDPQGEESFDARCCCHQNVRTQHQRQSQQASDHRGSRPLLKREPDYPSRSSRCTYSSVMVLLNRPSTYRPIRNSVPAFTTR
jgi:hypothetical protein